MRSGDLSRTSRLKVELSEDYTQIFWEMGSAQLQLVLYARPRLEKPATSQAGLLPPGQRPMRVVGHNRVIKFQIVCL